MFYKKLALLYQVLVVTKFFLEVIDIELGEKLSRFNAVSVGNVDVRKFSLLDRKRKELFVDLGVQTADLFFKNNVVIINFDHVVFARNIFG